MAFCVQLQLRNRSLKPSLSAANKLWKRLHPKPLHLESYERNCRDKSKWLSCPFVNHGICCSSNSVTQPSSQLHTKNRVCHYLLPAQSYDIRRLGTKCINARIMTICHAKFKNATSDELLMFLCFWDFSLSLFISSLVNTSLDSVAGIDLSGHNCREK